MIVVGLLIAQPVQLVLFSPPISALSANITQAVFEASPTSIAAGQRSSIFSVRTKNATGVNETVNQGTELALSSSSSTGRFASTASSSFGNANTANYTISAGTSLRSFYYMDTTAGTHTITATVAGGGVLTPVVVTATIAIVDQDKPTGTVTLSNDNGAALTNQDVTATLKTNEPINTPEGWTRTSDTVFTKLHSENGTYSVSIVDLAGNGNEVSYTVQGIDKIKPTFGGVETNKSYNTDITYSVSEEDLESITVDGVTYDPPRAPKTITGDGSHTLAATDQAGNSSDLLTFIIDTKAPTISFPQIANGPQGGTTDELTIAGEVTDDNSGVTMTVTINGDVLPITSSPFDYKWDISALESGSYVVRVVAKDAAGTEVAQEQTVVIDNDGPMVTITSLTQDRAAGTVNGRYAVRVQLTDEASGTQYTFVATAMATSDPEVFTWSIDLPVITNGSYAVSATSIDDLGNRSALTSKNTSTLLIDRVVSTPVITTLPSVLPVVSLPVARAQVTRQSSAVDLPVVSEGDEESVLNLDATDNAEKTVPVAATEKGWSILGLTWYWWGAILGAAAIGWKGLGFLTGK